MKKNYFGVIVALVTVASVNVLSLNVKENVSNLRLANIIALSDDKENGSGGDKESSQEWGCGGNPTFIPYETLRSAKCQIWGANGTRLLCQDEEKKVCCDPSKQTNCTPIKIK